ncbi:unnamed protein product [Phytophthora lilii]|uniref:Unnamed protein product n=1 Tax=Phytophthora lilii TaxID=2077276 RepID=A0A9W6UBL8_9STRA|nr:unnamed protein product [Phytophthora lilii]
MSPKHTVQSRSKLCTHNGNIRQHSSHEEKENFTHRIMINTFCDAREVRLDRFDSLVIRLKSTTAFTGQVESMQKLQPASSHHQHRRLELQFITIQLTQVSAGLPHDQLHLLVHCKVHDCRAACDSTHRRSSPGTRLRLEGSTALHGRRDSRTPSSLSLTDPVPVSACQESMELRCLTNDAALVKAVKKLNLGVLPVQPPAFCYRRAERDQHRLSWAAIVDGDVVSGAAVADLELERDGQRAVQLRTLAVPARFRRQGIGRQLVMKVIEQAKLAEEEDGDRLEGVRLHVHAGNDEALAFYKALGFVEKARAEDYYRHLEPRTALMMEFSLH